MEVRRGTPDAVQRWGIKADSRQRLILAQTGVRQNGTDIVTLSVTLGIAAVTTGTTNLTEQGFTTLCCRRQFAVFAAVRAALIVLKRGDISGQRIEICAFTSLGGAQWGLACVKVSIREETVPPKA